MPERMYYVERTIRVFLITQKEALADALTAVHRGDFKLAENMVNKHKAIRKRKSGLTMKLQNLISASKTKKKGPQPKYIEDESIVDSTSQEIEVRIIPRWVMYLFMEWHLEIH